MTRILLAVLAATGAATLLAAQPQFRVGTTTVAVYTTVTDDSGRLVTDLTRDDFEVLDNGKAQTLVTFSRETQPITVVLLLDRSQSMRGNFRIVARAAGAFVERLEAGDKARIGSFSGRVQLDPHTFTSEKDEMMQILDTELQEAGPTPLWNAVGVGMTALLHVEGRRVVLVFTDGVDFPSNGSSKNLSLKDVKRRAEQEDVMVYAIGLATFSPFTGRSRGGRGFSTAQIEKPDKGLKELASASGGGYFELTRTVDLGQTFARVADELHRQYLLAFVPQTLDGKAHHLEVRLRKPGLTARARKSYVAPSKPR